MIAALFVLRDGPYAGIPDIDLWDQERDARLYDGPYPVVAHPPCERWGRYWHGGPSARVRRVKGDDAGCFAAALHAVRSFGGILEHPAASAAWDFFGLKTPPRAGGWINADFEGGWTCCVDQEHYGHRAQKATWLYAVRVHLPSLKWGKGSSRIRLDEILSAEERRRKIRTGVCQRLSRRQRLKTPEAFRDLLLSIARTADRAHAVNLDPETIAEKSFVSKTTPACTTPPNVTGPRSLNWLLSQKHQDEIAEECFILKEQSEIIK